MLNKFVKPKPHVGVLKLTHPLNNTLFLFGAPLFNKIPLVNKLPFLGRGLCHIKDIRYLDESALQAKVFPKGIHFIGPNHPEFFTDWMLDKHVVGTHHLSMANWAAHSVVNGMGKSMQKFWLANNLIAQIPGSGNQEGKAYALEQALAGHPVLMHPEGMVHWTANHLTPIFDGIADLAIKAHQQAKTQGMDVPVFIHTPTWKLVVVDETRDSAFRKIDKEIQSLVQYWCSQDSTTANAVAARHTATLMPYSLAHKFDQVHKLYLVEMLKRVTHITVLNRSDRLTTVPEHLPLRTLDMDNHDTYPVLLKKALIAIWQELHRIAGIASLPQDEFGQDLMALTTPEWKAKFKRYANTLKQHEHLLFRDQHKQCQKRLRFVHELLKFDPNFYATEQLTVEEVIECLQRLRTSFCHRSIRDKIHQYVPTPIMARRCYVNWETPLNVSALMEEYAREHDGADMPVAALTAKVFAQMQSSLHKTVQAAHQDVQGLSGQFIFNNPWRSV